VDFFNPRALAWWHRQQDVVLDAGIDGWKLDFGDSYVTTSRCRPRGG
jgi:alpha-glucosidase (family GH31 glycosyl hydrolase)